MKSKVIKEILNNCDDSIRERVEKKSDEILKTSKMKFKKQFKEAHPETIGETDSHYDKSNYIDWIDKEYAQLQADKEELIEKLEEIYGYLGSYFDGEKVSIGELIQKHKQ